MDADSFSNASFSKDLGKKKRANRLAKLKQCKFDVRREQWLSQIKNKGSKEGSNGRVESSPSSMQKANEGNKSFDCFKSRSREEENEGLSLYDRDLGTLTNDPINSSLCSKDSSKGLSGSKRGTCGSSCSGSVCDDEEDECTDDWEAVADALNANNQHQRSPAVDDPTQSDTYVRLADFEQANKNSGVDLSEKESRETVCMNCQAWMPGDAFRPQSLPSLSKQHNVSATSGWHCGHGVVAWAWQNIMPQPSSCPICCEDLDVTDSSFLPCSCGFRLCLFCHKRILEADGRCPGCRKQYDLVNRDMCFNGGTTPFRVVNSCGMISRS